LVKSSLPSPGRFEKMAGGLKKEGGRFEKSSAANCVDVSEDGKMSLGGGKCGLRGLRKR